MKVIKIEKFAKMHVDIALKLSHELQGSLNEMSPTCDDAQAEKLYTRKKCVSRIYFIRLNGLNMPRSKSQCSPGGDNKFKRQLDFNCIQ